MHSIGRRLTAIIVLAVLFPSVIIGVTGVVTLWNTIDAYAEKDLETSLDKAAEKLDGEFGEVEQAINVMRSFAESELANIENLECSTKDFYDYNKKVSAMCETVSKNVPNMDTYYMRYNPKITGSVDSGFYCIRDSAGEFRYVRPTPITDTSESAPQDLTWYVKPAYAGHATWITPYYNDRVGAYLTTYGVPLYKNGELIGIIGADMYVLKMQIVTEEVETLCDGTAFIMDSDGRAIYHKDYNPGEKIELDTTKHKIKQRTLANGMVLAVMAEHSVVYSEAQNQVKSIIYNFAALILLFSLVAYITSRRIGDPLKRLNDANLQIARGNYDVDIDIVSDDEIGDLATGLRNMAKQLKSQNAIMSNLAYNDALTGIKNNTSYRILCNDIDDQILEKRARGNTNPLDFCVVVFDLNGLKLVNDEYGHDAGNKFIISACDFIGKIFGKEDLFRIGGDEFVLILRDSDAKEQYQTKRQIFDSQMDQQFFEYEGNCISISIACGEAHYRMESDSRYADVFERADRHMYEDKARIKEGLGM